jgi:hypothetical protein
LGMGVLLGTRGSEAALLPFAMTCFYRPWLQSIIPLVFEYPSTQSI